MTDLHNNIKVVKAIAPRLLTSTDVNSADVDAQGFEAVEHIVSVGVVGGSDTLSGSLKLDLILEHADADSSGAVAGTYAAVTDSALVLGGTVTGTGIFATIDSNAKDDAVYQIGYRGPKRFTRVKADVTGTHTGTPVSAIAVLSDASLMPVV
jgi:hypothetical protein